LKKAGCRHVLVVRFIGNFVVAPSPTSLRDADFSIEDLRCLRD
jgi:hypothetical protein